MKAYTYLSLLGLAGAFDASKDYIVSTDPKTKYITLTPKGDHEGTLLFLHGGGGSAEYAY